MNVYSNTDTLYNNVKIVAPSSSDTLPNHVKENAVPSYILSSLVTFSLLTIAQLQSYPLNVFNLVEKRNVSNISQGLNILNKGFNNCSTTEIIYTSQKYFESFLNKTKIQEEDTEDLVNWDTWIENPPISKTITIKAKFIKGSYILPSIDVED
jgi:hypothetical protein